MEIEAGRWVAYAYGGTRHADSELQPAPKTGLRAQVIAGALNVRSGPGVNHGRVGVRRRGDLVDALAVEGSDAWGEISPGRWAAITFRGSRFLEFQ